MLYLRTTLFIVNLRVLRLRKLHSWNIVFFGTDEFSLASLYRLHCNMGPRNIVNNLKVVTKSQHSSPVHRYAKSNNIEVNYWPPTIEDSFHLGIVVSFGKLIPEEIINSFPLGIINVHASLLPKYRGPSPICHAIKNGETETGISIMKIKPKKFDIGDVILQKKCSIGKHDLMPTVKSKLCQLGGECLIETLQNLPDCLSKAIPQDDSLASQAPVFGKEVAEVKWNEQTSLEIYNLYRSLYSLFNLKTTWQGKMVKLKRFSLMKPCDMCIRNIEATLSVPGSVFYCEEENSLRVKCKEGFVNVSLLSINGKTLSARDFNCGYCSKIKKLEERIFV